ncbi:Ribosomal RNA small subunit methyltransferase E [hydrothermal vent metagenome]|uniref:16S rRNA (uracil(1498)-N(3))-methyltransferase n=1 Tax=hydrothermal vent metagenome TaxID=652676 RepID=A0A1W1C264_9ZZZZ
MQYLQHDEAGVSSLVLTGDKHRYIFKVRRHKESETIALRNLQDENIYFYNIDYLDKKQAHLQLKQSEYLIIEAKKRLHIAWCVIEPKSIEKVLPTLNEMGVDKITFIYCKRSQKSFKLDFKRLEKILLNSSQQCGRSSLLKLETSKSLETFLEENPQTVMLNFSEYILDSSLEQDTFLIGCEGGFTKEEVELFDSKNIMGLDTALILKSESAVCAVGAKLLL